MTACMETCDIAFEDMLKVYSILAQQCMAGTGTSHLK